MKLTVLERLNLPVQQVGSLETQLLVRSIMEKASLTQEEIKKIGGRDVKQDIICPHCKNIIKEGEPGFKWDDNKYEKDIEFTKAELVLLKREVDRLSQEEQITQQMLSVCLKVSSLFPKEESK